MTPIRDLAGSILLVILLSHFVPAQTDEPMKLEKGHPVEKELKGGESDSYQISANTGEFVSIIVVQKGIDVVLKLFGADGTLIQEWDSPNGSRGNEELKFMTESGGNYRIDVTSLDPKAKVGTYEVQLDEVRPQRPDDTPYILSRNASQKAFAILFQRREDAEKKAKELFEIALTQAKLINVDLSLRATTLNRIGRYFRAVRDNEQALSCFDEAADLFLQLGLKKEAAGALLNGVSAAHLQTDKLKRNNKIRDLAREIGDKRLEDSALIENAMVFYYLGQLSKAETTNREALEIAESAGLNDKLARIFDTYGNIYTMQGRFSEAIAAHQKSLDVDAANGAKEPNAGTILNIGNVYQSVGRYELAIETYQRALEIFERKRIPDGASFAISNIGGSYQALGQYDKALEYFLEAKKRKDALFKLEPAGDFNLATVYEDLGRYEEAEAYFEKALNIAKKANESIVERQALAGLSGINLRRGEYAKAEELAREALEIARKNDQGRAATTSMYLVKAQLKLGKRSEAIAGLRELIEVIESRRSWTYLDDESKLFYMGDEAEPYVLLSNLLTDEGLVDDAFSYSERIKATALTAILDSGRSDSQRFMTADERETESELRTRISTLNTEIAEEDDETKKADLKKELARVRSLFEDLGARVYARHPQLKVRQGELAPIISKDIRSVLDTPTSVVLEFALADDRGVAFVSHKAKAGSVQLSAAKLKISYDDLESKIKAFRTSLAAGDLGFRKASRELYDLLIKPVEKELTGKTNIIIVPDGPLWDLPFQALLDSKGKYLIEKAAVSYAPSLTALREMSKRAKARSASTKYELVAFGNPTVGKETAERVHRVFMDEKLDPLPEAERLVTELGNLYGKDRSRIYVEGEARESVAKSEIPKYRIVQFATHGILNNISPMYSHLVMAQNTKDPNEDGLLEAWELKDLNLNADLVILSACDTARGKISGGEGVIGMSWAAFIAGAPSIVASQWKVESSSTTELMLEFHRQLLSKKHPSKAEALRQASLKLMRSKEYSHPSYWAGFIVVGDGN